MFTRTVLWRCPLSPSEVEAKLSQAIGENFAGQVGAGRFEFRRLPVLNWNEVRGDASIAVIKGSIRPLATGAEVEVVFTLTRGITLTIAFLFAGITGVILANTGGSPPFRGEHLVVLAAISIVCGICFAAFRMDAARCESLLRKTLRSADAAAELKAEMDGASLEAEEAKKPPRFTWPGLLARLFLVSLIVPSAGGLIYLGVHMMRSNGSRIAGALIGIPMICVGLIFLMPLGGIIAYMTRIWMFAGRVGPASPSEDPRRTHLD